MNNRPNYRYMYTPNSLMYDWIIFVWLIIAVIFGYYIVRYGVYVSWNNGHYVLAPLLALNIVFVVLFFLLGVKSVVFFVFYHLIHKREMSNERKIIHTKTPKDWHPKVILLYHTTGGKDWLPYCIAYDSIQTYDNTETVIADDVRSKKLDIPVRKFQESHPNIKVFRHKPHGFKAGNSNNALKKLSKIEHWDYVIILDSDEIIDHDCARQALHYFFTNPKLGILQGNHVSGRNDNAFMRRFHKSANTFWTVANQPRIQGGMLGGVGHGVIISHECLKYTNYFQEYVAEDLTTTLIARFKGFDVGFASYMKNDELFPCTYDALNLRNIKFAQSSCQILHLFTKSILRSRQLKWFQKLDVILFVGQIPFSGLQILSLALCTFLLPLSNVGTGAEQLWMLIPVAWAYFSMSINDFIIQLEHHKPFFQICHYEIDLMLLYGSATWINVRNTFEALCGHKAKFITTPKSAQNYTFIEGLKQNWQTIIFGALVCYFGVICSGCWWVVLPIGPCLVGWIFAYLSNHKSKQDIKLDKSIDKANKLAMMPKHEYIK